MASQKDGNSSHSDENCFNVIYRSDHRKACENASNACEMLFVSKKKTTESVNSK
jgi:hypothetical protein